MRELAQQYLERACIWHSNNSVQKVAVLILGLHYLTETVLSINITRIRIDLTFKDSPRKPLERRPKKIILDIIQHISE